MIIIAMQKFIVQIDQFILKNQQLLFVTKVTLLNGFISIYFMINLFIQFFNHYMFYKYQI